jgi:nucleotide-binding universal stress UspA family protein
MTPHRDDAATTLVVGHSNDPAGDYALIVAADLAQRLHARLHIVHVVETGDYPADCDTADWDEQCRQQLSQTARAGRAHPQQCRAGLGLRGAAW